MLNHTRRALTALAVFVAVPATIAACSSSGGTSSPDTSSAKSVAAQFPVTVQAANGSVTIARKPTAIVSMSPTATEMLFAIGAGRQVKAVDKNSNYPASAPHTALDSYQLNAEAIVNYRPDLVIVYGLPAKQLAQLKALHLTVLNEPAATGLADSYSQLTQLGLASGHRDGAAAQIATMKRQIASIVKDTPKPPGGAKYYYELDQTYYSVTSSTFIGRVLSLLGLTSIADAAKGAAASGGYPQLSSEFVVKSDPAYVFLADTKCCKQSVATIGKRPGWTAVGAVTDGRVVPLDDDIASRWGPRIVDLLRAVGQAMRQHPAP
ncbi:MAG: cobalamin transport system substrate-binding protein [Pseudonocardiales bacterium]|jgi:iron complex transport system substrate-binding protein|nr:cobalamin transport system substrate-binding protein [Pseudonocardiales bacterium]